MADSVLAAPQDEPGWPHRTLLLGAIGALAALLVQQLAAPQGFGGYPVVAWRIALATGIGVGAMAFGFGLSRVRQCWTITLAIGLGAIAALIVWWNGEPKGPFDWGGASLALSIAIALPLFQTARDGDGRTFPYRQVHDHAWTNLVLWGACWAFAGLVLLLSHLLAELFALIGITAPRTVLDRNWSNAVLIGAAFGTALGMLRDRDGVVRLLRQVATAVLGVLAPVLAVALLLFVVSLPFTGLDNLWQATKSTTPVLIACVIGALVLANVVIGHGPEDEARSPALRWSALALGLTILPLAVLAAIAMGLRIGQHGMTPERLWGLVVTVFAVGYGLVYLADALRGRLGWAPLVRRDNVRLAFATMAVALLLATPLLGFNAISARDQVARLTSGGVSADKFDWAALAFDLGEPGRRALAELSRSANAAIANRAAEVAKAGGRYEVVDQDRSRRAIAAFQRKLRVVPVAVELPAELRAAVADTVGCGGQRDKEFCAVLYHAGANEAWVLQGGCFAPENASRDFIAPGVCNPIRYSLVKGGWSQGRGVVSDADAKSVGRRTAALNEGRVDVRTVPRRQLFIGDEPVGEPFE